MIKHFWKKKYIREGDLVTYHRPPIERLDVLSQLFPDDDVKHAGICTDRFEVGIVIKSGRHVPSRIKTLLILVDNTQLATYDICHIRHLDL